jgi:hypothetical protein
MMEKKMTKEQYLSMEKALDKEMASVWPNTFYDGIADYDKYCKAKYKILWILKEVNKRDEKYHDFREFYKIVEKEQTYYNIMRVSYAMLNDMTEYDEKKLHISDESLIDDEPVLDQIAIININKSGGGSTSNQNFLEGEYGRNGVKELLFKQIELIDPQIIINCHHVRNFFMDQIGSAKHEKDHGELYAFTGKRLIIDTGHPLMAHTQSYCDQILKIFKIYMPNLSSK